MASLPTYRSISCGDDHIQSVHLVFVKVALVVLLALALVRVLDDGLLAVDDVLLHLVRQHALDRLGLELAGDLGDHVCHRVVLWGRSGVMVTLDEVLGSTSTRKHNMYYVVRKVLKNDA